MIRDKSSSFNTFSHNNYIIYVYMQFIFFIMCKLMLVLEFKYLYVVPTLYFPNSLFNLFLNYFVLKNTFFLNRTYKTPCPLKFLNFFDIGFLIFGNNSFEIFFFLSNVFFLLLISFYKIFSLVF
uniref:Uncharacterized protein n=1 Tax=Heterorhabditis bacteriophora TaxID=37862 RepID=A0A1I7W810_HETBA